MNRLEGLTCVVTGGASGIGRATAIFMAHERGRVVVSDVDDAGGEETARIVRDAGGVASYVHADVTKEADIQRLIDTAASTYERVDVLFNNAGIEGPPGSIADLTLDDLNRVLAVNLVGVFLGLKYGIKEMLRHGGGGSIINTASVAGLAGFPGLAPYCASKGAVIQLTKTAALEYATAGIRVNAICPGLIDTPMLRRVVDLNPEAEPTLKMMEPVQRFGTAEEVAALVIFLACPESSFVTGAAIPVDGAYLAR